MPTVGTSPGDVEVVVTVVPFDAGAGAPRVGMSPARVETESKQASAVAAKRRFIIESPFFFIPEKGGFHLLRIALEVLKRPRAFDMLKLLPIPHQTGKPRRKPQILFETFQK